MSTWDEFPIAAATGPTTSAATLAPPGLRAPRPHAAAAAPATTRPTPTAGRAQQDDGWDEFPPVAATPPATPAAPRAAAPSLLAPGMRTSAAPAPLIDPTPAAAGGADPDEAPAADPAPPVTPATPGGVVPTVPLGVASAAAATAAGEPLHRQMTALATGGRRLLPLPAAGPAQPAQPGASSAAPGGWDEFPAADDSPATGATPAAGASGGWEEFPAAAAAAGQATTVAAAPPGNPIATAGAPTGWEEFPPAAAGGDDLANQLADSFARATRTAQGVAGVRERRQRRESIQAQLPQAEADVLAAEEALAKAPKGPYGPLPDVTEPLARARAKLEILRRDDAAITAEAQTKPEFALGPDVPGLDDAAEGRLRAAVDAGKLAPAALDYFAAARDLAAGRELVRVPAQVEAALPPSIRLKLAGRGDTNIRPDARAEAAGAYNLDGHKLIRRDVLERYAPQGAPAEPVDPGFLRSKVNALVGGLLSIGPEAYRAAQGARASGARIGEAVTGLPAAVRNFAGDTRAEPPALSKGFGQFAGERERDVAENLRTTSKDVDELLPTRGDVADRILQGVGGIGVDVAAGAVGGPAAFVGSFSTRTAADTYAHAIAEDPRDPAGAMTKAVGAGLYTALVAKLMPGAGEAGAKALARRVTDGFLHNAPQLVLQGAGVEAIRNAGTGRAVDWDGVLRDSLANALVFAAGHGLLARGEGEGGAAAAPAPPAGPESPVTRPDTMRTPEVPAGDYAPGRAEANPGEFEAQPIGTLRRLARSRGIDYRLPREQLLAELRKEGTPNAEEPSTIGGPEGSGPVPAENTPQTGSNPPQSAAPAEAQPPTPNTGERDSSAKAAGEEEPGPVPQPVKSYDQLRRLGEPALRDQAKLWGVTYDAPSTTIPRIVDAQERWRLGQMTDRQLYAEVKARGGRASNRQRNIETLVGMGPGEAPAVNKPADSITSPAPDPAEAVAAADAAHRAAMRAGENFADHLFQAGTARVVGGNPYDPNPGGRQYDRVDPEVGRQYDAHGIAKGSPAEQVRTLFRILHEGPDFNRAFHTAPFEVPDDLRASIGAGLGTAGGTAYKDGVAVVTGPRGRMIEDAGIRHVFVNDAVPGLKEAVQRAFPNVDVHYLSEQKAVLENEPTRPAAAVAGAALPTSPADREAPLERRPIGELRRLARSRGLDYRAPRERLIEQLSQPAPAPAEAPAAGLDASTESVKTNPPPSGETVLRGMTRRAPWGDDLPDPIAQDILRSPEVVREIPPGSKPLGAGAASVVLETPAGDVVRIGPRGGRPNLPEVLQPTSARELGRWQVERLPKVRTDGITEADVETMRRALRRRGYEFSDAGTDNLGRTADGRLVVVDAGAVRPVAASGSTGAAAPPEAPRPGTPGLARGARPSFADSLDAMDYPQPGPSENLRVPVEYVKGANYSRDLGEYADRVWRETSADEAAQVLKGELGDGHPQEWYFANSPELALGQGGNQGVMMELDPAGIRGRVNTSKPMWEPTYRQGLAELIGGGKTRQLFAKLRAMTIRPDAQASPRWRNLFTRRLRELEQEGWAKQTNADGSVTYRRPETEGQGANRPAAGPATPADVETSPAPSATPAPGPRVSIEPAGEGGRYVVVKGAPGGKDPRSVFGRDGLGGRWHPTREGWLFAKSRMAEVRAEVDRLNAAGVGRGDQVEGAGIRGEGEGKGAPAGAMPVIEPGTQTPANEPSRPQKRMPPRRPVKLTTPRPFTKSDLERRMVEHYDQTEGVADVEREYQAHDLAERTGGGATVFRGEVPADLRERFTPEEWRQVQTRGIVRRARGDEHAGGEDSIGEAGMGIDRYERMVRDRLAATDAGKTRAAIEHARRSPDPEMQLLAAIHDNLPPAKERGPTQVIDPSAQPTGTTFSLHGHAFEIVEGADGHRLLKDGDDYPVLPADYIDRMPADRGSVRPPPAGDEGAGGATAGNPPAGTPPATPGAAERPRFFEPEAEGIQSGAGVGIFGQTTFDPATGNRQGSMFHEPIEVKAPGGESARDARIRAKFADGEGATGAMFGGDDAEAPTPSAGERAVTPEVQASGADVGGAQPSAERLSRYELERKPIEELRALAAKLGADPMAQEGGTERRRLAGAILEAQDKLPRERRVQGGAPAPQAKAVAADDFEAAAREPGNLIGSAVDRVKAAAHHLRDSALRYSGKMFPTITRLARESGEAAARYVASRAYAKEAAPVVAEQVIGPPPDKYAGTGEGGAGGRRSLRARLFGPAVDPELDKLVGGVLVEDNLRSIRAGHEARAKEAGALATRKQAEAEQLKGEYQQMRAEGIGGVGRAKAAVAKLRASQAAEREARAARREQAEARSAAGRVGSIVDADGSPLSAVAGEGKVSFPAALKDPRVRAAVARYKAWFANEPEANYRTAQEIAPDADLPTRGEATGARVNLKAVDPDDPDTSAAVIPAGGGAGGNPANALAKASPFARRAKGTAAGYEIRLSKMIEHTLARGTEIANQRRFYDRLVKDGLAQYGEPGGAPPAIGGRPAVGIDVQRRTLVSGGRTVPQNKKLYVRRDAYPEVRRAINVDERVSLPFVAAAADVANRAALISLGEATAHVANQLSAVVRTPGVSVLGAFRRGWDVLTSDPQTRARLADLARIGAAQESRELSTGGVARLNPLRFTSRLIHFTDRVARLVVDDAFAKLVKRGLVKDTETNRRDLVNQLGQYNARAQHRLVALARELKMGPFATAGSNFYAMGLKNLALSPGVEASSLPAAAVLRGMVLARFGAALGAVALANWHKWGRADGGTNVPFGAVRLDDAPDGRVRYFDVLGLLNVTRGLRAVGAKAVIEGVRRGDRPAEILDQGVKDAALAAASPILGPVMQTGAVALTGHDFGGYQVAKKAAPGESQSLENVKAAAKHFNPLVGVAAEADSMRPADLAKAGTKQLGKFAVKTGRPEESVALIQARRTLARQSDGLTRTPEQQARHDARRRLVAELRAAGPDTDAAKERVAAAVREGVIPHAEAGDVRREAGRSGLANMVRRMGPEDAVRVYGLAKGAEREQIAGEVRDKIVKADHLPPAEQDQLLARAGIAPPPDLALSRELHALNQRAADAARAKREAEALARRYQAARARGDAGASDLRRQAYQTLKGSQMSEADQARHQLLQEVHRDVAKLRQAVDEGTLSRERGESLIRRLWAAAAAGTTPAGR